ncbi:MAG TPA: diguanylate cyclase, partial [Steroidobacteraceae bacterium]|nr:diguanylate cyclase [Steroidobacteraceae bacterium]
MSRPPDDKTIGKRPGKPVEPWSGFEPYAQLCRALLPRIRGICILDARGALRWSSDAAAAAGLLPVIAGALATARSAPESAGDLHRLPGDVPAYVCWIRDDSRNVLAALAIVCVPAGAHEPEARAFPLVHALLAPALECLRRDLLARVVIGKLKRTVAELNGAHGGAPVGSFDTLTGLYTRPAFESRVRQVVAAGDSSAGFSSLYINVDQLHVINDNFGMRAGDTVL